MNTRRAMQSPLQFLTEGWTALAVVGIIVIGTAGYWPTEAGEASGSAPRLEVDRTEIDLGDLPLDRRATAVFTLTNAGNGMLNIID
jgi:hypothetical protein